MKRKDEAKARDILAATLEIVAEHGISGLSMEHVARRAGVATGTLYVYHASKEALIDAAYLATKQALATAVFRDEGLPVRPAFAKIAAAYLDYLVEHRAEVAFLEQVKLAPFLSDATRQAGDQAAQPLRELLERGKREQLIKPFHTQFLLEFLNAIVREMALALSALPPSRRAAQREHVVQMCWDAIRL
jgi:AcrR family transcriptional regulator